MTPPSRRALFDAPATYHISVYGWLESEISSGLGRAAVSARQTNDEFTITTLTARLADQAGLLGVLNELYEMGYTLLEARRLPEQDHVASDAANVMPAQA
ncbi:MAG: hypothetical protein MUC34_13320 [Anaerolineae bacterium]|jgi:hypothetical protein|nr:hypothetical protein [Anaerolineae bacterium]